MNNDVFIKENDTLIPHLLNYMERNNFAWGLYVAMLYVVESKHYMKIAFYFDIDDNNNEFVKIFQGRYEGIYRGTYKIVEIEVLDVY